MLTMKEFALLQIIGGGVAVAGSEILRILQGWPYKEWIRVRAVATIVSSLGRLYRKGLIWPYEGTAPEQHVLSCRYRVTKAGKNRLRQEVLAALASAGARDYRFDLAVAAVRQVTMEEALGALTQRKRWLAEISHGIDQRIKSGEEQDAIPRHIVVAYRHPALLLQREISFMELLMQQLTEASGTHDSLSI